MRHFGKKEKNQDRDDKRCKNMVLPCDVRIRYTIRILYIYTRIYNIIYYTSKRRVEMFHALRLYMHYNIQLLQLGGVRPLCTHRVCCLYNTIYNKTHFFSCFCNMRGNKIHQTIYYYCIILYVTNMYNVKRLNRRCSHHYSILYTVHYYIMYSVQFSV